jgi:CRISPR-associated endoribonuclease cas2
MKEIDEKVSELRYTILIIYDIIDNGHRLKISKYLSSFGSRVQKSAFEARLNKKQYNKLIMGLEKLLHKEDNIRIYKLYGESEIKTYGDFDYEELEEVIIV